MANFTPISVGAAANAATVNDPLYELDAAITTLQTSGGGNAKRPWAVIGSPITQPTASNDVLVTDHITHTGKLVRGATAIGSTNADMETRGNLAVGAGSHVFTGINALAVGGQNTVNAYAFASGQQNAVTANSGVVGYGNIVNGQNSFVAGLSNNGEAGSTGATIFGTANIVKESSLYATVAGGSTNYISGSNYGFIGAGQNNFIQGSSTYGFIGAGLGNQMFSGSLASAIGGGTSNTITNRGAFIGAGSNNWTQSINAVIGAGSGNLVYGTNSGILAGANNTIKLYSGGVDAAYSAIGAGAGNNILDSQYAFIGAGNNNTVSLSSYSAIGAGLTNLINLSATYSFIGAGHDNLIQNTVSCGFIGAGYNNAVANNCTGGAVIAGAGGVVTGNYSTVLNGTANQISGENSVLGGVFGNISHKKVFLWNTNLSSVFASVADSEFAITAEGGVRIFTNSGRTTGMTLPVGASSWSAVSAAALKGNFADVEPQTVLKRLLSVPIRTYQYKNGDGYHDTINLGPTAEDWDSAFADLLGRKTIPIDDREIPAINEGDKLGVALAAIQALTLQVNELKAKLAN